MKLFTTLGAAALLALFSASASAAALDDTSAAAMMKTSGCSVCHSVEKKIVGPAYKDVAAKRKGEQDALEHAVRNGSKGVYGPIPMPANPATKIADADLHDLVAWILTK